MKSLFLSLAACLFIGALSAQVTVGNYTGMTLTVGVQLDNTPGDCTPTSSVTMPGFTSTSAVVSVGAPGDEILRIGADGGGLNDWQYCPDAGGWCAGTTSGSGDFVFVWTDCNSVAIYLP